jgi:hypothetical protein
MFHDANGRMREFGLSVATNSRRRWLAEMVTQFSFQLFIMKKKMFVLIIKMTIKEGKLDRCRALFFSMLLKKLLSPSTLTRQILAIVGTAGGTYQEKRT